MKCSRCHMNEVPYAGVLCAMCIGTPKIDHVVEGGKLSLPPEFPTLYSNAMKLNQDGMVNVNKLMEFEEQLLPMLLHQPLLWESLDVDYHPPRVERLYAYAGEGYRLYLHCIHTTAKECLFHKHNWPAALKQVYGEYEMGITYSPKEVNSSEAHKLPVLARFIVAAGTYYEMTQTDALHYVRPITPYSLSIMLTNEKYPEHVFRHEANTRKLEPLSDLRKLEILGMFKKYLIK